MLDDFGKRYATAWCSQNPESVAAFFMENGSLSVNDGAPAVGRAAIAEVARGWTLSGTNSGPSGTGKRVRVSGHEDWRMEASGLIAESKGHFDAAEYARQVEFGVGE